MTQMRTQFIPVPIAQGVLAFSLKPEKCILYVNEQQQIHTAIRQFFYLLYPLFK
jgi:hypothetical protein